MTSKARIAKVVGVLNKVVAQMERTAASKFLIEVGGKTIDPLAYADATELQAVLEADYGYEAPPYKWIEDSNVEFEGPFPEIRDFNPKRGKSGGLANITVSSPFAVWVLAHAQAEGLGVPEALIYMDHFENLAHLSAEDANKVLKMARSGWDYIEMFEFDGDPQRFWGAMASDYSHILEQTGTDTSEMSDEDVALKIIEDVYSDYGRGWYEANDLVFTVYG
jgi:hypothetical protein